jgi:uncharacterized protein
MTHDVTRRDFLGAASLAALALGLPVDAAGAAHAAHVLDEGDRWYRRHPASAVPPRLKARPFDLRDVRLRAGPQLAALDGNKKYMMALEADRLLHTFRVTAGLPSTAAPLGGWEAPDNELRGHFTGHYLSACALMWAQTGDGAVRDRAASMVAELAKCQQKHGNGYLSAFPAELFDRLKAGQRVWAPFYTYHKIMAGLLDSWTLAENAQALEMVKGMATWVRNYVQPVPSEQWQRMLGVEYGGMNDILYELAAVRNDPQWAELAHKFDHEKVLAPLAIGRDELKGVHANTTIPKILGIARRYERTGEDRSRAIATFFWNDVTAMRSYATGGTSNDEEWQGEPGQLAKAIGPMSQETCCTYNMLKLTRMLFGWQPDARYADFYERAYFNGILPTQHPADGEKAYYTPLGTGYWKLFGTPNAAFWCCHGTGVENFAKLADSVYFHDGAGIWVNLFVPSAVTWRAKGMILSQETRFPESDTTTLMVRMTEPIRMPLRVRVPYWVADGGSAKLNGRPLDAFAAPGSYLVLDRVWRDGDRLEVRLPMALHAHAMPDDSSVQAVMFGPLVLAGRLGADGITAENRRAEPTKPRTVPEFRNPAPPATPTIRSDSDAVTSWVRQQAGRTLEFRTVGQTTQHTLVPLYRIFDERYVVFWNVTRS